MSDDEAESALKSVVGRLALLGVSIDVCEHYSPMDCYELLRDTILPEMEVYAELIARGWAQHIGTYDYCPQCAAERPQERRSSEGL